MTINRVTQSMMTDRSLSGLQGSLTKLSEIQEQLSTGRILNRPSDNPTDATSAMRMRSGLADQQQYARNAEDGLGWLNTIDSTLQGANDQLRRARDLALQGVNGATSASGREALAAEVDQIRAGLVATANTTYLGRPVFGGTTAGDAAFGDTAGVASYVGDGPGQPERRGRGRDRRRARRPRRLRRRRRHRLRPPDRAGRGPAQRRPQRHPDRRRRPGRRHPARDHGPRRRRDAHQPDRVGGDPCRRCELGLTNALSEIENTDLPKAIVDLQMQEVAYQAALAATARVLQPSLLDFLR